MGSSGTVTVGEMPTFRLRVHSLTGYKGLIFPYLVLGKVGSLGSGHRRDLVRDECESTSGYPWWTSHHVPESVRSVDPVGTGHGRSFSVVLFSYGPHPQVGPSGRSSLQSSRTSDTSGPDLSFPVGHPRPPTLRPEVQTGTSDPFVTRGTPVSRRTKKRRSGWPVIYHCLLRCSDPSPVYTPRPRAWLGTLTE